MVDEKKIQAAVNIFLENPYWKTKYDEAPTELSKRATELGFFISYNWGKGSNDEIEQVAAERDKLRHNYSLADWKYELKYCGKNPFHAVCVQKVAEHQAQ